MSQPEATPFGVGILGATGYIGTVTITRSNQSPARLESIPDHGLGNRFSKHVFPAVHQLLAGNNPGYPDLRDGWRVQLFTDAAAASARHGAWAELG